MNNSTFTADTDKNERILRTARYIADNSCTVREAAAKNGISKSTVHKDMTKQLLYLSPSLYVEVKAVLDKNKSERHIRGGLATRDKYLAIKENREQNES